MNTVSKMIQLSKMKEGQFFCVNTEGKKIYLIDTIDDEHKKVHLIPFEQRDGDNSISLDFDECVYDSISDGSTIQKAWQLAGVRSINVIDTKLEQGGINI